MASQTAAQAQPPSCSRGQPSHRLEVILPPELDTLQARPLPPELTAWGQVHGQRHHGLVPSARIPLRVHPSAGENELVGIRDGVLVVRVSAPAIEGRANKSAQQLVAKRLRLPKSSVRIVRGHRSRDKVVEIDGLEQTALLDVLGL